MSPSEWRNMLSEFRQARDDPFPEVVPPMFETAA
jgi:hypothetical protein